MKDSTVSVRINSELKKEAENILAELGIPVSVLINSLYRQIIYTKSIPFSITIPSKPISIDEMSNDELNNKIQKGYNEAINGATIPFDKFIEEVKKKY